MLNLLPLTEKKKILNEYRLRLAVIIIFAIGALILASIELLMPSYFLASIKNSNAQRTVVSLEGKYGSNVKEKELAEQIKDINTKITLLLNNDTTTRLVPSQVIENILKIKDRTIKIEGFMYDATTNQERIILSGIARDRNSLAKFVETLKKEPTFTSVILPISSYVKSEDIDFSVAIERKAKAFEKK